MAARICIDAHGDFVDPAPAAFEAYAARRGRSRYEARAAEWLSTPQGRAWLAARRRARAKAADRPGPSPEIRVRREKPSPHADGLAEFAEIVRGSGLKFGEVAAFTHVAVSTMSKYICGETPNPEPGTLEAAVSGARAAAAEKDRLHAELGVLMEDVPLNVAARAAGVHASTVGRCLDVPEHVTMKTMRKVRDAMAARREEAVAA